MSETASGTPDNGQVPDPNSTLDDKVSPEEAKAIRDLRKESASYRVENRTLKEKLAEAEKKANEFDALNKKSLEEQGKYKELYEKAQADIAKKSELETRLAAIEAGYSTELDGIKKGLTEDEVKLIDGLEGVKVEQRLALARTLAGKKSSGGIETQRGGSASIANAEAIVKEFSTTKDSYRKMQILSEVERTNPGLYQQLMKTKI